MKKKEIGKEEKIVEAAKQRAITALEEMKEQEDAGAREGSMYDGPNASWHYKNAKEQKAKIDVFIKALKDVAWEDKNSLIMDTIVKAVLEQRNKAK